MIPTARKRFGGLDIAVNNAGLFRYQSLTHKWREDQWWLVRPMIGVPLPDIDSSGVTV